MNERFRLAVVDDVVVDFASFFFAVLAVSTSFSSSLPTPTFSSSSAAGLVTTALQMYRGPCRLLHGLRKGDDDAEDNDDDDDDDDDDDETEDGEGDADGERDSSSAPTPRLEFADLTTSPPKLPPSAAASPVASEFADKTFNRSLSAIPGGGDANPSETIFLSS